MKRKRRLTVVAALALSACGTQADDQAADLPTLADETTTNVGDDQAGADDESGDREISEADEQRAMAEYEACLSDLGVDFSTSDDGDDGGSIDELEIQPEDGSDEIADIDALEQAFAECDSIIEDTFGSFELSPEEEAEMNDQMLALQRCMADKGIDADFSGGNGSAAIELDPDTDWDALDAAMSECEASLGLQGEGVDQ